MKRSTKVFLGALGVVTAGWGVERALRPNPQLPPCPIGADGRPIVTPECQTASSRSSSSSSRTWGGSSYSSSSSSGHVGGGGSGSVTSSGGWGSFGRAFSSGG